VKVNHIKGFVKPSVSVFKEGKEKLIHTASSHGAVLDKELLEDGSIKESSYFFTPTGRKLRKILLKKGGQETELYKAYYGSGGQLILDRNGKFTRKLIDGKFHVYKNNKLITGE